MRAGERESPMPITWAKAPKEQPPRKLSGHRTARLRDTLESAPPALGGATEGVRLPRALAAGVQSLRSPDRGGRIVAVRARIVGLPFLLAGCPT